MKRLEDLAIFGGEPLFKTAKPIGQLASPPDTEYLQLVREIIDSRRKGTSDIVPELETELARFHGTKYCVAVANAGLGITMLMRIFADGRPGEVIMPAFSYRGFPHFARWAGQTPRFCDVDKLTHGLSPAAVRLAITPLTTSILGVCNVNSPGVPDELCDVAATCQVPIFFDSVYAMGCTYRGRRLGGFGRAEAYSLHATKLLNGFEGGYITTNDGELAAALKWSRGGATSEILSSDSRRLHAVLTDAQLNVFHAAMALAGLPHLSEVIRANKDRYNTYKNICRGLPGFGLVPCPHDPEESANYSLALGEVGPEWPLTRDETLMVLRAEGAAINPYYSPALHYHEQSSSTGSTRRLPISEALDKRFLQLPSGGLVTSADIERLGSLLEFLAARGADVATRIRRIQ